MPLHWSRLDRLGSGGVNFRLLIFISLGLANFWSCKHLMQKVSFKNLDGRGGGLFSFLYSTNAMGILV